MRGDRNPWQDGRRAWKRLGGWHQDSPAAPAHPDDGDEALRALSDIGLVRHLLDQAELAAVRTARKHGKAWAEIAVKLGVTRQSAWERWRDLDEGGVPTVSEPPLEVARRVEGDAAAELVARTGPRSLVRVPNVIGLSWGDARDVLLEARLVGVGPDPDGPPVDAMGWPSSVVTDQSPESGAKVPAGSRVTLWVQRGGGSGVREPRRPKPVPRSGRAMDDPRREEAVG